MAGRPSTASRHGDGTAERQGRAERDAPWTRRPSDRVDAHRPTAIDAGRRHEFLSRLFFAALQDEGPAERRA
jgi:hypothetical protein